MSKSSNKQSVALSSVGASISLTLLKLVVGLVTGSMGILSEAAHSFLDFGAALLTYFAVRIGDKPPDLRHTYGHGKVESVSALVETGLLFVTSGWIIYEAVNRLLFSTSEIEVAWYSYGVMIVSIIVDFSRSRALSRIAKATGSQALEADALHFSSDILSSLVVIAGLIFVTVGMGKGDAIAALGVSIFVLHAGYSLGKRTLDVLTDAAPSGLTERIIDVVKKIDGVGGIEKIRVRPVGATVFVDMSVTVNRKIPLEKAQQISSLIEKKIRGMVREADVTIHTKPIQLSDESIIERAQMAALNHNLSVHDVVVHTEGEKRFLSYDLEVEGDLTLDKAHETATHLENTIRREVGNDLEVNTHIEPLRSEIIAGKEISERENLKIKGVVGVISKDMKLVKDVHNIQIREAEGKLFLSLHCIFDAKTFLEDAHNTASSFEYLIKEHLPQIQRVVVHAEPVETKRSGLS